MVFTIRFRVVTAALAAVAVFTAAAQTAPKKVKDQGEYDLYSETLHDVNNPSKQLQDLETWTQRYPDSEYRDERFFLFMQAYAKVNPPQPLKVLEYGRQLVTRGLANVFPGPEGMLNTLNVLYLIAWNTAALPNTTPEQAAAGEKAARELLEMAPRYFVAANRPSTTTEAQWAAARDDIEKRGRTALLALTLAPGKQAIEHKECGVAEKIFTDALAANPAEAAISYQLGTALNCQARNRPDLATEIAPRAIYQFLRAAMLDPSLGGTADPKKIADYATAAYIQYHGGEDGLAALREQVKAAPMPPASFTIETATAVAARKEKEFAEQNPQLALWMRMKAQLADVNGQQYFDGQLKDLDVVGQAGSRALKGTVVEGRPACKSKELLVAVPEPGAEGTARAEILLRLDSSLSGRAAPGDEIEWDGVAKQFSREPFLLTMEVPRTRITGLKVGPCPPAGKKK